MIEFSCFRVGCAKFGSVSKPAVDDSVWGFPIDANEQSTHECDSEYRHAYKLNVRVGLSSRTVAMLSKFLIGYSREWVADSDALPHSARGSNDVDEP